MRDYLLFVDTETTGLPRRWTRPYAAAGRNWPHVAQVAWAVYTKEGELVKSANYYLQIPVGSMQASSEAIHGLSPAFLAAQGHEPRPVLEELLRDLRTYQPLVVGHYIRLDFHMLGVEFHRAGLPNPLRELPTFCTMQLAANDSPEATALANRRLGDLYQRLFGEPLESAHDAWADADATARCFFALRQRGLLTDDMVARAPRLEIPEEPTPWLRRFLQQAAFWFA
ncbi:3'-5' exonuclease [Hymenobacter sp. BT18]|uniref:3'-5' exonuclease n=1 Tax=Hymenobacter sp. BT18 TaxID=2835648 RepID=UPI00143E226A|nr:3'-5' exonuclease [Hymenobacter sp. BT18]QIX60426.1 3'-5' exonuclease [Hymenobacter sp. BT18]